MGLLKCNIPGAFIRIHTKPVFLYIRKSTLLQIMVRVKDAELQKLRSQVKNTENSLERITEVKSRDISYKLVL